METIAKNVNGVVKEKMQRIENLNLEAIMVKLMEEDEGKGWSLDQCFAAEKWYKRYLLLNLLYPGKSIVPNKQIDTFWHYHILDTMKYQEDCEYIFGYFLHHFPYLGLRSEEDAENLVQSFDETLELMGYEFGESLADLNRIFSLEVTCHGTNCGNSNGKATCHGSNCGNTDGKASLAAGCDSGCHSTCHVSCRSSCHASPVGVAPGAPVTTRRIVDHSRPTLASVFNRIAVNNN